MKRLLIGEPLHTQEAEHHRLPVFLGLPVLASDAMSSVAYATEEILIVLTKYAMPALGAAAFGYSIPIAIGISLLYWIVVASYQQTIRAYPTGGGAYIVSRDNLGELPAQTAGAALLVDYILTVSVSIAAGVAAIDSAIPALLPYRVEVCLLFTAFMTVINLRGVRESGWTAAGPCYLFLVSVFLLIIFGFFHVAREGVPSVPAPMQKLNAQPHSILTTFALVFILMHAFSNGCAAITGVEAISNGLMVFRPPEARNGGITMIFLAVFCTTMFMGVTVLSHFFHILPAEHETVLSQLGHAVFHNGVMYYVLQVSTMAILVLAANTAFADFPRLASLHAGDGFLPRQFTQLGERLVFQNGIFALGAVAAVLIVAFHGKVDALIPLYAIGVFLSFTMSQVGMVKRWFTLRSPGWWWKVFFNGTGAVCCFVVMVVFAVTKFSHGAWIVIILVPLLVSGFFKIHHHYKNVAAQLSIKDVPPLKKEIRHKVMVLVPGLHKGVIPALDYAKTISNDVICVHIELQKGSGTTKLLKEKWEMWAPAVPLIIMESPYRQLYELVLEYIDLLVEVEQLDQLTVLIPEFVTGKWWTKFLHNQSGFRLKMALLQKRNVVVSNIRFYIQ